MKKTINSKHIGSMVVYALLSLFLCMAGVGNASAAEQLNPVVKIDKTSYTSSGTEVTLKLWMFNWKQSAITTKQYNARFTGNVYLYIDDKEVGNLKDMWSYISGSNYNNFSNIASGTVVGKSSDINLNGTNVGTAQFQDFKSGQTCPYNSNTTEDSWFTIDLKLSFNKSFSYYGHKITVKGKWQDQGNGTLVEKDVALDNDINGFVRPINLKVEPSGDNMVFSWEQQGYNSSASTDGKWVIYKCEGDNNVKLGEVAANEHSLGIEKKQYNPYTADYNVTFLPNVCKGEETVSGLTTTIANTGRFFCYQTSDGNKVNISRKDFGAKVVAHWRVGDGSTCVIEFDASITKIPKQAFFQCKKLIGNLVIPNSVTEIGNQAFYNCSGFTGDLSLPISLEVVGSRSFDNCRNIQTVNFQSLPKGISENLGVETKTVSLSDDSYISDKASGTVNEISYTRVMTSNWGTLVLPYPLKLTGDEPYRLYSIDNMTGEELVLKQLDGEVAAGTPCVVKRNGSESELTFGANDAELNMTIDGKTVGNMTFNGTYWAKEVTNGYVIAKDCFWNVAELNKSDLVKGVKVKPFRAWLDGTSPNGASQLSICVSDTATGIGAAGTIGALNDTATEYYDLSGKRLDEPQRGVNIVRMKSGKTKKIIIK